MREKLIELIHSARFDIERICNERFDCDGCPADIHEGECKAGYIADHLIANGVTVQQWIPVTERLPEKKGNYLGWTGSTFMIGYYKGNAVWWIWSKDVEGVDLFTHWMPLPEPPKTN